MTGGLQNDLTRGTTVGHGPGPPFCDLLEAMEGALLTGDPPHLGTLLRADRALSALEGGEVALQVEGSLTLSPGQEGGIPVQILSPFPVRVEVRPDSGLSAYLFPNPAQGQAFLRVRASTGVAPGTYQVALVAGGAAAQAEVRVVQEGEERVVLKVCPAQGNCQVVVLPREGGPFRVEANPGQYRLLAFLDADGDGF